MKALVVYYSRTGHTKKIAETIADMLACDKEALIDTTNRSGFVGFMRSGYQAKRKSLTDIKELETDVSAHDLVIVGTPVWAGTVSAPVRTFLHYYKDVLKTVAFFSTHGGEDTQDEFTEMETVCGKTPVGVVSFSAKEVDEEEYIENVKKFVDELDRVAI